MRDYGLEPTREALRQRQGSGARYDATSAPTRDLDLARRGTAYFARLLNGLSDAEVDAATALPGFRRRDIIANIGYHARALSEVLASMRRDVGNPLPVSIFVDEVEVRRRASQPAHALRSLVAHSSVHLNVEWRDLNNAQWDLTISDATGKTLAVRDTPRLRAEVIWLHAIYLNAGGRIEDVPKDLVHSLDGTLRPATPFYNQKTN
ncbi:maleylpyruvate isomerase N-terminal domain-containing protein [Agrobacterium tumefaciens]|uniref:Maleylpyruvate isomerase family mycothiol-dependent enzyme n=1 Tax=Agrobacterium tumefaciens TaxID=358 RepID=A0AA44JA83_AGRTU|nr:maleylpyruvate isomerase family mycothiol-dependent enzyme [Agrobacterium tumefaciens]NSL21309.1 maleylpyruvate isomerase family mycothiol-dependent enzyme [Agrobacterium tumefaciens]NTB83881.1 maleylpyruvate isomerase family mycothiol-dependent enzyme [Agrobacterium tumefaciens]NTC20650.1 maleylpyruvate isomerase family mycothiol-dependent enzyme [Agrobacterium tumefaciens]NTC29352.1 maleylpyruvate isomerase family mycothiol-dependent enzyme [Agrobacterium tumefaciens]NTC57848.1 maleylpyru